MKMNEINEMSYKKYADVMHFQFFIILVMFGLMLSFLSMSLLPFISTLIAAGISTLIIKSIPGE